MENKKELKVEERKSNLALENRKKIVLTGVVEVLSFDEEKILLNTCLGMLTVKGEGLKMNKLDVQNGDVVIIGKISAMIYTGEVKKEKENIFKKIFK
ncbi:MULTISPECIES: sporulation protein YabP [Clostridium]|uniref:Sporulation protein YabP n=3 Tax=Clostridium TaxID=1485 RepID=A0A9W6DBP7_9CLOT|nr:MULTISPECIES: sporulation protein YabP [Clostridium]MBK1809591.1 sporulation protein YabP [Clostridium yunnanense]GFZ34182.1 sporulation protein YabP [Clostridium zeae]GKU26147.1 sporulation protein YabP [Clostridium folliculivorans]GKU28233.1 sporulation protein YabP [Clostridium folliculivorans]